ncbi:hypothetical protein [Halorubrum sp. AS12]|uniref:hypothetical protein n=1 Tax=Halorubrum sp. AS12 TaxID=3409687 RepID=UPI003DA7123C
MRVVAAENLEVRAGQAFNDDGTVRTSGNPNFDGDPSNYVEYDSNSAFFDPGLGIADLRILTSTTLRPRQSAVAIKTSKDVEIQVATYVDTTVTFTDIVQIENDGTDPV